MSDFPSGTKRAFNARTWRTYPAVLWMIAIFFSSSRTGGQLNGFLPWVQKWLPGLSDFNLMHYAAYFVLGLTVAFALGRRSSTWQGCLINIAICLLYGLTDEWHQAYVPMRTPDALDLLHDGIGATVAGVLVLLGYKLRDGRRSRNYTSR